MADEDKMKLSRGLLPREVKNFVGKMTKDFDPKSKASIDARVGGRFSRIERLNPSTEGPSSEPSSVALASGAKLYQFTDAKAKTKGGQ